MSMHKCENCEIEVHWHGRQQRAERCQGWTAIGRSRFGREYDRRGIAWWCPDQKCQEAKDLAALRNVLPNTPRRMAGTECNVCHQPILDGEGRHFGRFHFHDGECYDLATQRLIHFLEEIVGGEFEEDEGKPVCPDCGADMVDGVCWYCENKPRAG